MLVQYPATDGAMRDYARLRRARARRGRARRRRDRPARADAAHAAGRVRRRHRRRLARSASACRWASAARTRRSSRRSDEFKRADARAASSACRRTRTASRRCAWRCRRASSTSAARRRQQHLHRAGAARGDGRRCTRSTTGPTGLRAHRRARARPDARCWRAALQRARAASSAHEPFFDTLRVEPSADARRRSVARPRERAHQPARTRRRHARHRARRDRRPRRTSRDLLEVFGGRRGADVDASQALATSRRAAPGALARTSAYLDAPGLQHATTPSTRCCATSPARGARPVARRTR